MYWPLTKFDNCFQWSLMNKKNEKFKNKKEKLVIYIEIFLLKDFKFSLSILKNCNNVCVYIYIVIFMIFYDNLIVMKKKKELQGRFMESQTLLHEALLWQGFNLVWLLVAVLITMWQWNQLRPRWLEQSLDHLDL